MIKYYTGETSTRTDKEVIIPASPLAEQTRPEDYKPHPDLVKAVNVALILGQPLLVTGEPGTGKTQLAFSIAYGLGYYPPLIFETRSTSTARDLFYTYDTLSRFHAAQTHEGSQQNKDYIQFNALGRAILRAAGPAVLSEYLPEDLEAGKLGRSVVLIDEIDKAPRDFPNDILNEVEGMYFKVPELRNQEFRASPASRPVLVLTSNSEKNLPDAFLRRCVYFHIKFPDPDQLADIVAGRTKYFEANSPLLKDAIAFFNALRQPANALRKKPATAELLAWLTWLKASGVKSDRRLGAYAESLTESFTILMKTAEDVEKAKRIWNEWMKQDTK